MHLHAWPCNGRASILQLVPTYASLCQPMPACAIRAGTCFQKHAGTCGHSAHAYKPCKFTHTNKDAQPMLMHRPELCPTICPVPAPAPPTHLP
eukprot:3635-Chlamydomonas_euryale.AAC.3